VEVRLRRRRRRRRRSVDISGVAVVLRRRSGLRRPDDIDIDIYDYRLWILLLC
jgi:hypothetical protein